MKKIIRVSIGIPAYNEEGNIGVLLKSILRQEEIDFTIKKILVVSDASFDNTVEELQKISDKRIKLIQNKTRKGQIYCQNLIFSKANTDAVILFEADTVLSGKQYIQKLVEPILINPQVGMIQGNIRPVQPKTLLGRVLYSHFHIYWNFSIRHSNARYYLATGRSGRLFTKKIYKKLVWPVHVPEDSYAYLWCLRRKIKTAFVESALCTYKLPQVFQDFLRERQKIAASKAVLKQYFSKSEVEKFYHRPLYLLIQMTLIFLVRYPHYFFIYGLLIIRLSVVLKNYGFNDFWKQTSSTKIIYE